MRAGEKAIGNAMVAARALKARIMAKLPAHLGAEHKETMAGVRPTLRGRTERNADRERPGRAALCE